MTLFTHFFFWPKFIIGWIFFFGAGILCGFLLIGTDLNAIPAWKLSIGQFICKYCSYGVHLSIGALSRKKRIYFDYSKWLGPDKKPIRYEGAGINISNHISAFDMTIMLALTEPMSSFIAKDELRLKLFLLKDFLGVMFVKRNNSSSAEDRDELLEQIRTRQI